MSVSAVSAVLENSKSKGLARLVFVCIAERMKSDGRARCSLNDVAKRAAIFQSNVSRLIKQLEELGELLVLEKGDTAKSNLYQISPTIMVIEPATIMVIEGQYHGDSSKRVSPSSSPPPITSASSLPLFPDTPPLPPQGGNGQLDLPEVKNTRKQKEEWLAAFEEFWAAILPANRKGKKRACELFLKALKNGTTIQEIFDGIPSFRKDERKRSHQNDYRPLHADTWMSQERWKDSVVIQQPVEQEPSDEGWIEKSIYG